MTDLLELTLTQQAEGLRDRTFSVADLHAAHLGRVAQRDPLLNAIVHLDQALPAEPDEDAGALAGLMIGIKDIIDVAGAPTRSGSHAAPTIPAAADAACVATLRAQGIHPFAKLATYEYALTGPAYDQPNPPARNPWNRDHITGGSSSGSAAAVAGGLCRAALGTDTGGSIRAPAAYCGIVGLKPTWGSVDMHGTVPLSESLDVVGPLAACVSDAALVLDALRPHHPLPAHPQLDQLPTGLTIGYARDWFVNDPACDPQVIRALDDAAATLSSFGLRIELIALPDYALAEIAGTVILQAEALANHKAALATRFERYGADARRNLLTGAVLTAEDIAIARDHAAHWRQRIDGELTQCAALLAPTTLGPAPAFADFKDGPVWTAMRTLPFNMTGHPAISVPCGFSGGLPLGLQLIGRMHDEAGLCRIAYAFEQASDFGAHPPLQAAPQRME